MRPSNTRFDEIGGGLGYRLNDKLTIEADFRQGQVTPMEGRRRFLNPYLGLRLGYGYVGDDLFVLGADVGVELYKHKWVLVDAFARTMVLLGDGGDAAVQAGAAVVVLF